MALPIDQEDFNFEDAEELQTGFGTSVDLEPPILVRGTEASAPLAPEVVADSADGTRK
ncbi:hypothetical protein R8Z50_22300 [Longispora sp. K20-0274]|uniref:hypothetical protein n=1 Tax=Longispora sp. K20-0274 TaxID=3088255 RepID=UPI00399A1D5B